MGMADAEADLSGMASEPGGSMEQETPTSDGLGVLMGIGQAHEEAPPVGGQGDEPRHEAAALDVACGEASQPIPSDFSVRQRDVPQPAQSLFHWAKRQLRASSHASLSGSR